MVREPAPLDQICDIYIDESSQTKNRYLVLGGLIVHKLHVAEFEQAFANVRVPELPAQELKWGKVSRTKLPAYRRVVSAFWDDPIMAGSYFHSLVVDTHQQDHTAFNEGDHEVGFNKEIYQLLMKFRRLYGGLFHVYLDYRDTDQAPEDLRVIANRGCRKSGDRRDWPFRRCHFRDSKASTPLQLVDIFVGAIAYHVNKHNLAFDASPAKCDLAKHILEKATIRNPRVDTPIRGKFTIWHRQLKRSPRTGVSQP